MIGLATGWVFLGGLLLFLSLVAYEITFFSLVWDHFLVWFGIVFMRLGKLQRRWWSLGISWGRRNFLPGRGEREREREREKRREKKKKMFYLTTSPNRRVIYRLKLDEKTSEKKWKLNIVVLNYPAGEGQENGTTVCMDDFPQPI